MIKTTSNHGNKGTALLNYVTPYIVTQQIKHNTVRNVRIRYKMMKKKLNNGVTTPHHDINL